MECRPLLALAAGLLLAGGARAHSEDGGASRVLHVSGGDFPALVMVVPGEHVARGVADAMPGCDRIRARRLDELAPGWRQRVARIELECEDTLADDEHDMLTAVAARALLHPGRVQLAGQPVVEVRLMDSQRWGDHQYVLASTYPQAAPVLKDFVEDACRARVLAEEGAPGRCTMLQADDGYFLPAGDAGGIWIHADSDDATRTLYVEAWAD